ncbi:MAG: PIG-L family deacetylase [Limnochordales bacterium]|nr:PIG-L family deacetylase [Limnochordales bacterium]
MKLLPWRWAAPRAAPPAADSVTMRLHQLDVQTGSRWLVVAPHCDDEILGAGGLLHTAIQAGGAARVVLLTNGDGYNRAALRGQSRRLRLTPQQYIEFAYLRQRETLAALAVLGLSPADVVFCGYPDRGLAAMWEDHWDFSRPYRSRFTRVTRSPYENSRTRGAVFCGESVVRDLEEIVREFRPTHVIVPHPHDTHGDHWAGCCFTLYALERLRLRGRLPVGGPVVLQYLVHQGTWPQPRGYRPRAMLVPPKPYARLPLEWLSLELPEEAVERKLQALLCYRSQMVFMRRYLLSFVRRNELFGLFQPLPLPWVEDGGILVDGESYDWDGVGGAVVDPRRQSITRRVGRSADIRAVAACRDRHNLYLRMELRHRAVNDYLYGISLYGVGRQVRGEEVRQRLRIGLQVPDRVRVKGDGGWEPTGDIVVRARRHQLEVGIPLALLGWPERVFLGVETRFRGLVMDRVAWQVLDFVGEGQTA